MKRKASGYKPGTMHKDDFWLVAKALRPDITYDEFLEMWDGFIAEREKHQAEHSKKNMN